MNVLPRSPVFVIAFYVIFLFRHFPVQYFDFFRARKGKRGVWGEYKGLREKQGVGVASTTEPKFGNLLRNPGIDSQPGRPVRQPYLTYRSTRLHRLGSLNVYKFGLCVSFLEL